MVALTWAQDVHDEAPMRQLYWLGLLVAALLVAIACVYARRTGGRLHLWVTAIIAAALIAGMGVLSRGNSLETPTHTYLLLGIVPTIVAALLTQLLARNRASFALQITLASLVWLITAWITLLSTFYP